MSILLNLEINIFYLNSFKESFEKVPPDSFFISLTRDWFVLLFVKHFENLVSFKTTMHVLLIFGNCSFVVSIFIYVLLSCI